MSGGRFPVLLGWTSTEQMIKWLLKDNNIVPPVNTRRQNHKQPNSIVCFWLGIQIS